jgi:hypothetical protein
VSPGFLRSKVFDNAAVQTGVQKILTDSYGAKNVTGVVCPAGVKVASGASFTCTASVDGDKVTVPIKVTSDSGDYEVGRPA